MSAAAAHPPPLPIAFARSLGGRIKASLSLFKTYKGLASNMFCGNCCKTFDCPGVAGPPGEEPCAPEPMAVEPSDSEASGEAEACGHLTKSSFEVFGKNCYARSLPIVLFSDDARQQLVWNYGSISKEGEVQCPPGGPDVWSRDAVVMSPAYLGFCIEPYEKRYLHFKGVGIVFARPPRGKFMQPSIDTILVCHALDELFQEKGLHFSRAIEVGTGSGFIGKFMGAKAPGEGRLELTLVDVDPCAEEYCRSAGFAASSSGAGGREVDWSFVTKDAAALLKEDSDYDLIVSNPPYIPTQSETEEHGSVAPSNFWEGCGLLTHMLELMLHKRYRPGSHLVLMVTSLTLKAKRVCALLEEASERGLQVRVLLEREIAWKAWYAGSGSGSRHLMAQPEQVRDRQRVGQCDFFVGACPPGRSRLGGERNSIGSYNWHFAYVLDIFWPAAGALEAL